MLNDATQLPEPESEVKPGQALLLNNTWSQKRNLCFQLKSEGMTRAAEVCADCTRLDILNFREDIHDYVDRASYIIVIVVSERI